MSMIDIIEEPRGETYRKLVDLAERHCRSFSLVWRHGIKFRPQAVEIERALAPFLMKEENSSEWPGTRLLSDKARVCYFRLTPESVAILHTAGSLYAWLAPDRPEDLAFYRTDGKCLLGSIAHEAGAFLDSVLVSRADLEAAVPGLRISSR